MNAVWFQAMRPKTLPAAAVPVCVATAQAFHAGGFEWIPALVCLVFALLIQVGANFANDYYDGIRGTDSQGRLGPRRAVASGLIAPKAMLRATCQVLGAAFLVGLILTFYGGWWLVAVGLLCVLLAFAYTGGPFPLAYLGLGDVFVVLFFGIVPVTLTYFLQTGEFVLVTLWTGLACGALATNLLVVNNYRDAESDALANKRTLVVRFGRRFALRQYFISVCIALVVPVVLAFSDYGVWVLVCPIVLSVPGLRLCIEFSQASPHYCNRILEQTALFLVAYGVLLSVLIGVG